MPEIGMFWALTTQENEVLCVSLNRSAADLVMINRRVIEEGPCVVTAISSDGIHFSDGPPVVPVVGLFLEEDAANQAATLPRETQSWDDWFADQTEAVLQAIGWNNPLINLVWQDPSGRVLTEVERRFQSRLPDRPPVR